ncbi:MAG: deoxyribose-phosphate aldolase [Salinivirgaceae bacterium]|nr:MAG: deoxyribose-phosphate aldolase [Salinivirgaceae bacterium]
MDAIGKYNLNVAVDEVKANIEKWKSQVTSYKSDEVLSTCLNLIDYTTLTELDNEPKIIDMCDRVNHFAAQYSNYRNVAAMCVYPSMVPYVKKHLKAPQVNIAAVGGGFPASQTFTSLKVEECRMAVEAGANEIDIVIPVGEFINGNDELVFEETKAIKEAIGTAHLKVILETGDLNAEQIRRASLLAMEAGADFIKTSTGKVAVSATHEAMHIMCEAIADYYKETGRKVGIKPAGGIRATDDAIVYYLIVKNILGEDWLNNELFRFGASSLANSILQDLEKDPNLNYF